MSNLILWGRQNRAMTRHCLPVMTGADTAVLSSVAVVTRHNAASRNWFLELLNPVSYVVVRDIAIGGIGILGAIRLKEGDELVIAIPSGEKLRGLVVRSQPDPLFPKLYRTGIRLHRYPTAELFARWQSYIQPQDKADFDHECQVLKQVRGA